MHNFCKDHRDKIEVPDPLVVEDLISDKLNNRRKLARLMKQYVWVIDQARGQDGWILAKFFFCVFMDRDEVEVHKLAKKERGQYPAILTTNLVNKGFIIWLLVKFCLRDTAGSPERARWLHLARPSSQSQRAIWFILPAHGASHVIKGFLCLLTASSRTASKNQEEDPINMTL